VLTKSHFNKYFANNTLRFLFIYCTLSTVLPPLQDTELPVKSSRTLTVKLLNYVILMICDLSLGSMLVAVNTSKPLSLRCFMDEILYSNFNIKQVIFSCCTWIFFSPRT